MTKVLILYHTLYGNIKKVAMALSRGLEAGDIYVDCISIQEFDIREMNNYTVFGIGCPTHYRGASKLMKLFLKRIKSLNLKNKQAFVFETKADFRLAGSAGKEIVRTLKRLDITIVHPIITGIVLDKSGPLQERTLDDIEQIGLLISEQISVTRKNNNEKIRTKGIKNSGVKRILNYLAWVLIGGGPISFFIRAIQLASAGGDCFGTINPIFSWILLTFEIFISGFTGILGVLGLVRLKKGKKNLVILAKYRIKKIILSTGISSYAIHFTRVVIWIVLCVI